MTNNKEMCFTFSERYYKQNKKDEKEQESLLRDSENTRKIMTQSKAKVQPIHSN